MSEYILRKPIEAEINPGKNFDSVITSLPASWDAEQTNKYEIEKDQFDELFVSVEDIQQQIRDILRQMHIDRYDVNENFVRREANNRGYQDVEKAFEELSAEHREEVLAEVLAVVYGKEKP